MSEADVEIVRRFLSAFAGVDFVAFIGDTDPAQMEEILQAVYAPDAEVRWVDTSPDSRPYKGHEGVLRAMTDWLESFDEFHIEPTEFIDAGQWVLVPNLQRGKGKDSGADVEMTATWAFLLREGKIANWHEYSSTDSAMAALSPQQ